MKLRQPGFWYQNSVSAAALALSPFSALWRFAGYLRAMQAKPYTSSIPVICIGNIMIGGSGKTPTALAVAELLKHRRVCFLTRGYGGSIVGPALIDQAHDSALYGDEALLLSRHAPTIVSRDRVAGLKLAEEKQFEIVITDDGFQNPHFAKTLSLLVIDGAHGLGNGRVIPAGPLRESVADATKRANAVLVVGADATNLQGRFDRLPFLRGDFKVGAAAPDKRCAYVAFAGIGRPDKFFTTLRDNGYTVVDTVSFPDHHVFSAADIDRLNRLAARHNASLITTEKDHVRLSMQARGTIAALPVTLEITGDIASLLQRVGS